MKNFLGYESNNDNKNESCFPNLTFKERIIGFLFCFALGYLIQFFSMGSFIKVLTGKPDKFAVLFTLGNIVSICGTFFLVGPQRQLEYMKSPHRKITSLVFVISLAMTLISVYVLKMKILVIVFVVIQFCAYVWYVLSYIPYGRTICKGCLKRLIGRADQDM